MAGHDRLAHKQALSLSVTQLLSNRPLLYEGEQDTASLLTPPTMTETKEGRIFEEDVDSTKHALAQMVIPSPSSPGIWQWLTVSSCISSGYISCYLRYEEWLLLLRNTPPQLAQFPGV